MCGIAGWIGKIDYNNTSNMLDVLSPRGPDAFGEWISKNKSIWFGHRRLKVLDLSDDANQPMISQCGRYILCYNGEIYNYKKIKNVLSMNHGVSFKGTSDTEVLLYALIEWGVDITLKKIKGMFSFSFYDTFEEKLSLARDPFGIKPLYYYKINKHFLFASSIDSLRASGQIKVNINSDALHYYFRYLCTPHPDTIFDNVKKLPPGSKMVYQKGVLKISNYYNNKNIRKKQFDTIEKAADELDTILRNVIEEHMASDVSYGAFLSGGIDSSLIVSIMQSISNKPINTFSIGFQEVNNSETGFAKEIARFLGTNHHEKIISPNDIRKNLDKIISIHDEPFSDNSNIPTYFLCKFAKENVTVALSGDGGDELFGGYPRYFWASRIESIQKTLGMPLCKILGSSLNSIKVFSKYSRLFERFSRLGRYLKTEREFIYPEAIACWDGKAPVLNSYRNILGNDNLNFPEYSWAEEMMLVDQKHYLPDDILTKVDRMSMAVSLEARVPLLDTRIAEFSSNIKNEFKLGSNLNLGKLILREVLSRYLPKNLFERPKSGFGLPIEKWLRNDLRDWAESFINPDRLKLYPILDEKSIMKMWDSLLRGNDVYREIWSVITLIVWLENKEF